MDFDEPFMMAKKVASASLCLFFCINPGSSLFAQNQGCEKLQSTSEQSECLVQKLVQAEADMKRTFQQALSNYLPSTGRDHEVPKMSKLDVELLHEADKRMVRSLRQSQARWLAYRESACSAVENMYDRGTIVAEAVPACKIALTQQRTDWLRSYFEADSVQPNAKFGGIDPLQN
jgi:uncharacterized protein YecT (DUF1311 family)